jgi:hypothetical protein
MNKIKYIKLPIIILIGLTVIIISVGFARPAFSQILTKEAEGIPAGTTIEPGEMAKINIQFPGDTRELRNPADTILVMDTTGSMSGQMQGVQKIVAAKNALKAYVDQTKEDGANPGDYAGLVTYNACLGGGADGVVDAHLNFEIANMTNGNKTTLKNRIDSMGTNCGTPIGAGLNLANRELLNQTIPGSTSRYGSVSQFIVLATDGVQNTAPSPYQNNILQTAIDEDIVVFTVGIGNDVHDDFAIGGGCIGCPDIPGDGMANRTSGEMIMKDIACRTDQHRPDPAENCDMIWDTTNDCDELHDGSPTVNDRDCPDHYYFTNDPNTLDDMYVEIANEISRGISYQVLDMINMEVFEGIDVSTFKVYGGLEGTVTCDPPTPEWTVYNKFVMENPGLFMVLLAPIQMGEEVCITFNAKVHELSDNVLCDHDGDPNTGRIVIPFSECLGSGRPFSIDDANDRLVTLWDVDELGDCDLDDDGTITFFEVMACYQEMQNQIGVDLPEGQINVVNPARPWFQTKYGTVGTNDGDFDMSRDLLVHPLPAGEYHASSLVLYDEIASEGFTSRWGWLAGNYIFNPDSLEANSNIYGELWERYSSKDHEDLTPALCRVRSADLSTAVNLAGATRIFRYNCGSAQMRAFDYTNHKPIVVFVNGDLHISDQGGIEKTIGDDTGVIFIVNGDISVDSDVRRVDGFYIAAGKFNSGSLIQQLIVNGSVLVFGVDGFELERDLTDPCIPGPCNNFDPAELFRYDAKYLWLFRNIIGDFKMIYSEMPP